VLRCVGGGGVLRSSKRVCRAFSDLPARGGGWGAEGLGEVEAVAVVVVVGVGKAGEVVGEVGVVAVVFA
jgi:hypothetical protein